MNVPCAHVDMGSHLFYFDRIDTTQRPTTAKINRFDPLCVWQPWRGETHHPIIDDAGWHFQYFMFGGREHLLNKLDATCHAGEGSSLRDKVAAGQFPDLSRTAPYPLDRLPRLVREQRERFAPQFCP